MSEPSKETCQLPPEQQAIRDKCFHPSGRFVEFPIEDVETSIPARFEKIVNMYPERLAVKVGTQAVTYEQLNRQVNSLAWAISQRLGDENKPVAMFVEQDLAAIVAILAVLKLGKIYVALDASFPAASIETVLSDCQPELLVSNSRNADFLKSIGKNHCEILFVDEPERQIRVDNPGRLMAPDKLATILYTSGSTGKPKGVLKNHRGILQNIMSYTNDVHVSVEDRLTLLHSCATNASIRNLLGALLNGAALFPFNAKKQTVAEIADWLTREQLTIFHAPASLFRALTGDLTEACRFDQLRLIQLSNEPVAQADLRSFKKFFARHAVFANRLGSTETDTYSRWFMANDTTEQNIESVPAGYPMAGTDVFLLDDDRHWVAGAGVGEIVVKSRHLALGYWRQPELTALQFRSDPDGGDERWYFTGDLGRRTEEGCLYHLGRKDFSVRIRGQNVNLSQIEAALLENGAVKEVVVNTILDPSGIARLVAYVVAHCHPAPSDGELREGLRHKLPDVMIPSAFVLLDFLPMTPAGKVDRSVLPAPGRQRPSLENDHVAARTPTEALLVEIWADRLNLDTVGIDDNFFDLGGDSLAASRIISRVIQSFKLALPVQALFEAPTVASMALLITQHQTSQASEETIRRLLNEIEAITEEEARSLLKE